MITLIIVIVIVVVLALVLWVAFNGLVKKRPPPRPSGCWRSRPCRTYGGT
jgi:hypothetical protein